VSHSATSAKDDIKSHQFALISTTTATPANTATTEGCAQRHFNDQANQESSLTAHLTVTLVASTSIFANEKINNDNIHHQSTSTTTSTTLKSTPKGQNNRTTPPSHQET
jgi:hypothetical protein